MIFLKQFQSKAIRQASVNQSAAGHSCNVRPTQVRKVEKINIWAVAISILGLAVLGFAQNRKLMAQAPPHFASREAWRASMAKAHLPGKGCFHSSYPSTEWRQLPCVTAPRRPYRQHPVQQPAKSLAKGSGAQDVGNTDDYELQSSGLISEAIGTFYSESGVTSASGDSFSLQLNSNFFTTSTCSGASDPSSCQGWEQFVFSNSGSLFIQNWLINYGTCPNGWNTFGSDCWMNSTAVSAPVQAITSLASVGLTGRAYGGTDTIYFTESNGGEMTAMSQDSVLNLEQGWNAAEFNIFGDCCGSQLSLNAGSTLVPEVRVDDGTSNVPSCVNYGTTGETSNLSLAAPCCPYVAAGTVPSIQFIETNLPNSAAVCGGSSQVEGISITINNPSQTTPLSLGHSMTYTANVTPLNGYDGSIGLSMSDLPAGLSYSFSPQTLNYSGSSTLTLTAAYSPSTYVGNFTTYVDGTAVGLDDSAGLAISTQPLQYKGDCGVQKPAVMGRSTKANMLVLRPVQKSALKPTLSSGTQAAQR